MNNEILDKVLVSTREADWVKFDEQYYLPLKDFARLLGVMNLSGATLEERELSEALDAGKMTEGQNKTIDALVEKLDFHDKEYWFETLAGTVRGDNPQQRITEWSQVTKEEASALIRRMRFWVFFKTFGKEDKSASGLAQDMESNIYIQVGKAGIIFDYLEEQRKEG